MRAHGISAHLARRAGLRSRSPAPGQSPAAASRSPRRSAPRRARCGYESINFDLIYGLPGQTRDDDVAAGRRRDRSAARSPGRLQLRARAVDQAGAAQVQGRRRAGGRGEARALRDASRSAARCRLPRDRPRSLRAAARRAGERVRARHAASQLHGLHRSAHHGAARPRRQRDLRDAGLLSPEREGDHGLRAPRRRRRDADAARTRAVG